MGIHELNARGTYAKYDKRALNNLLKVASEACVYEEAKTCAVSAGLVHADISSILHERKVTRSHHKSTASTIPLPAVGDHMRAFVKGKPILATVIKVMCHPPQFMVETKDKMREWVDLNKEPYRWKVVGQPATATNDYY